MDKICIVNENCLYKAILKIVNYRPTTTIGIVWGDPRIKAHPPFIKPYDNTQYNYSGLFVQFKFVHRALKPHLSGSDPIPYSKDYE